MKTSSQSSKDYFGTISALTQLNIFKIDIFRFDFARGLYQPVINLNLAPCAYSTLLRVIEGYLVNKAEVKENTPGGYVSLQIIDDVELAVINFARILNDSVSVNYSVVNTEISTLIIELSKNILDKDPSFTKDCT